MAEIPMITPLASWAWRFAALAPAVLVSETPVAAISVRTTDPGVIDALTLPGACAISSADGTDAIWLGPDEWLLTRPGIAAHDWLPVLQTSVDAGKSAPGGTYLADTTGQRTRITLDGPYAATVLAHGCAIDLSPGRFGDTAAVQTFLAQAGVIVHRENSGFALYVRSSFADYLAAWIVDAATEYTATTESPTAQRSGMSARML
ncbi:sarcosine oxidase subunit gamma [uncultured Gordonia sp.]|uniref:sarcosine oxidase subunit gamma n=1 Tax=uncultured Gordonia sp. TaxID=198437 RepID=UPI0026147B6B|nr:sarcosine oxidase subunit gamma family protein [uncultured Gordonia sp.]